MSISRTNQVYRGGEHFQPDDSLDPQAQKRLRGRLEKIDYTTYASNREVIGAMLGATDTDKFQRMAVVTAQARALWVKCALDASASGRPPTPEQVRNLTQLRTAYQELSEAYDGMRRLVERGYLSFREP